MGKGSRVKSSKSRELALVILFLAVLVCALNAPLIYVSNWRLRFLAGLAALTVLLYSIYRRWITAKGRTQYPEQLPLAEGTAKELQARINTAGRHEAFKQRARLFARGILYPEQLRQRVVEEYEPDRRTIRQKVTVDFQLSRLYMPPNQDEKLLVPLLVPKKGDLHDDLEVFDSTGRLVSTYSYREYLLVAATAIRFLLASELELAGKQYSFSPGSFELDVEEGALKLITRRKSEKPVEEEQEEFANRMRNLTGIDGKGTLFFDLVKKLSTHYCIIAVMDTPIDGRFSVSYCRTIIPTQIPIRLQGRQSIARVKNALRMVLGARPVFVQVEIENAWTCNSYHLHVKGPEGLYLAHQKIETYDKSYFSQGVLKGEDSFRPNPYFRFRRRLGQRYAHFYTRFFPTPRQENGRIPDVTFTFYETPPGSDFQATIAAVSSFLLIWLVGITVAYSGTKLEIGSDAPVLLLAFPGAAASWIGFDGPARLLAGSLSARFSLIATAFLSIAASALYMLDKVSAYPGVLQKHMPWNISLMGIQTYWWSLLSLGAFANAAFIFYKWLVRSIAYGHLTSRPPDGAGKRVAS
jgi:hypothetical protein